MARRSYSDEERANALAALDANDGDVSRTARQLGVPRKTLEDWAKGHVHPAVAEVRQEKKGTLADAIEGVAWKLLDALPGKVPDADLRQTATALGIAIDKMRLLREQPTSITSDGLSDDERAARVAELLDAARARRDRQAHEGGQEAANGQP